MGFFQAVIDWFEIILSIRIRFNFAQYTISIWSIYLPERYVLDFSDKTIEIQCSGKRIIQKQSDFDPDLVDKFLENSNETNT